MRKFSIRPTLTMKGRTSKGPRGFSGKPSHPPLTDVPIAAYLIAAVFDVISTVAGLRSSRQPPHHVLPTPREHPFAPLSPLVAD